MTGTTKKARRADKAATTVALDVRPWVVAWARWPVIAGVIGVLAVADRPEVFGALLGLSFLVALWVGTFRIRIVTDADGGARLRTRTRSIDLHDLRSVHQDRSIGFPQVSLRAGRRVGIGGFGRWGPARWNRLLDALGPYVTRCDDVDPAAAKLWHLDR